MKTFLLKFYKHIMIFSLIMLVAYFSISLLYTTQKDQYLRMQTNILSAKYNTNYKYLKIVSNDIYQMYKNNKMIISTFEQLLDANRTTRNELRVNLYNLLKKRYYRIKNMGVEQLHFHLPDNTSFLRMHKPNKFGDNLTKVRETIALTNANKKFTEGFEVGRIVHGFRFVYPLFNSHRKHLGSVEVSFSSRQLVKIVSTNDFLDVHFLVLKEAIDDKIWDQKIYAKTWESSDYLLERELHSIQDTDALHNNTHNKNLISDIKINMKKKKAFSLLKIVESKSVVMSFVPISGVHKDKVLAYIVTYKYSNYLDTISMQKLYLSIILYSIIFLFFIFGIYVINFKEKLENMAHYDTLTELPNRSFFYIEFQLEIQRAKRSRNKLALLFLDLDGFKAVNDTFGHDVGDELLRNVSSRLKSSVREIDIVARLGGDEFTILLVDLDNEEKSLQIAKQIITSLNEVFLINEHKVSIGASIGITIYPDHGTNIHELISNADEMMYNVKNNHKNDAQIYKKESS